MDTSTLLFIITLAVAFIVMRWIISPIPQTVDTDVPRVRVDSEPIQSSSSNSTARAARARDPRPVTQDMIEVVKSIAPQLTDGQIRYDLERSGSVEITIENFMENGTLPFPPGEPREPTKKNTTAEPEDLIKKYGLQDKVNADVNHIDSKWGSSQEERSDLLSKRREEMILRARKRLESQLKNEI